MNRIAFTFSLLLIFSCSSPDDSIDITPNSNNQQTNNPINDGNNNDGNNNDGDNNDGNNNDGNNNDGNNNEINSLFFNKWNFSSNSSKNDFKTNLVDFIILRSNNEYVINLNGKEERGQFIYSNNTIELINKGIINSISINENQFTFELNLFNGQILNKTAYSDKYYSDGDCTSFLECTNGTTFSIASDLMYTFLKSVYQGEFFFFEFSNEPTGEWIEVWNNRKYLKIDQLFDVGLVNEFPDLYDVNFNAVTYSSSIDTEEDGPFNINCEEDWSKWSNKVLAYGSFNDVFDFSTQYTTLVENSFRTVRFSYNDNLGREIFSLKFTYNPDLSVSLEQSLSGETPFAMTFINRQIDTSIVDSNFCVDEWGGNGFEPISDIHFGYVPINESRWLNELGYYTMFTWWAMFLCELELCLDVDEFVDEE